MDSICLRVCACVSERESARDKESVCVFKNEFVCVADGQHLCACVCVCERERERERGRESARPRQRVDVGERVRVLVRKCE